MLATVEERGEVTAERVGGNGAEGGKGTWAGGVGETEGEKEASRQGPVAPQVCTSEVK